MIFPLLMYITILLCLLYIHVVDAFRYVYTDLFDEYPASLMHCILNPKHVQGTIEYLMTIFPKFFIVIHVAYITNMTR